jgi:hypothetical protein
MRSAARMAMANAPSTFFAARTRAPSTRAHRDEAVLAELQRVHTDPAIGRDVPPRFEERRTPCCRRLPAWTIEPGATGGACGRHPAGRPRSAV